MRISDMKGDGSVSVRLEGGLGDHVLGMRVLRFVRARYPSHQIIAYSDCGGHSTQLRVASMSPLVSEVVPVYQQSAPKRGEVGTLANVRREDMEKMLAHDLFIDAHGVGLFARAATVLNVPIFDILAHRPELCISTEDLQNATRLLADHGEAIFVGLNLTKYGVDFLRRHESRLMYIPRRLLEHPKVVVLNFFTSSYAFPHWPERERALREQNSRGEYELLKEYCQLSDRIVPCIDLPVGTTMALLRQCRYFIGLDNGIKHLAWALDIPRTFFHPGMPSNFFVMRWMPDFHRMLRLDCADNQMNRHLWAAEKSLHHDEAPFSARDVM